MPSSSPTPAQEEFAALLARNTATGGERGSARGRGQGGEFGGGERDSYENITNNNNNSSSDMDEDEQCRQARIAAVMRAAPPNNDTAAAAALRLPRTSVHSGCATGVKGVIADARHYAIARQSRVGSGKGFIDGKSRGRKGAAGGVLGEVGRWNSGSGGLRMGNGDNTHDDDSDDYVDGDNDEDNDDDDDDDDGYGYDQDNEEYSGDNDYDENEQQFMEKWRETRRRELERREASPRLSQQLGSGMGTGPPRRRLSPSVRVLKRMENVDMHGYLDAIEKVPGDMVVVVFVYDDLCDVSAKVEQALQPIVEKSHTVHFVKVHYEELEFDNAGVPAILAYKNQGDLFANLTGIFQLLPDSTELDSQTLEKLLLEYRIL